MKTISVSNLKTHLSAELKLVENGITLIVLDHKRPVATLSPIQSDALFVREASGAYIYETLNPLVRNDPLILLDQEREDAW
jgi:antitoxin (DNA-binding transcriptional repressor) of toxin-antitoxin stability system